MMACALTSIFAGVFDVKHYLHLQVGATPATALVRINTGALPFLCSLFLTYLATIRYRRTHLAARRRLSLKQPLRLFTSL